MHCAISKKRTGIDFRELHQWIDSPSKEYGVNHRIKRHAYNKTDEEQIRNYWECKRKGLGEKAVVEWLFHIAVDNLSTAFKRAKIAYGNNAYNVFIFGLANHSNYIYFDFDTMDDEEFDDEFNDGDDCVFRAKPATDSGSNLPPIPGESCHPFRMKPAT